MLRTRVIPCLLVHQGRLVKTVRFRNPSYIGDPVNAIKIYNEKEVDELILLDVRATVEHRPPALDFLTEIASECFMPLTYGGNIQTADQIKKIFYLGIEKVAINSAAVINPNFIKEISAVFGSQSIVVAIDAKKNLFGKYMVYSHGGEKASQFTVADYARLVEQMGAGEILLNSIDRDGTWQGYDLDLIREVTEVVNIPVIACGGAGSLADFARAVKEGASAVAAGSMVVYQGKGKGVLINFPSQQELTKILL
jgi:imidazole glycerol-phosphate synthase subunit HisF